METELNKLFRLADCHRKAISAEDQTTADKFENQAFELTSEYVIKMVSGNAKAVPAVEPVRSYFAGDCQVVTFFEYQDRDGSWNQSGE